MRLIFPLMQERNPIALRERRAYERAVPLWARRQETVGVIAAALIVCLGLVVYWLRLRAGMALYDTAFVSRRFHRIAVLQVAVWVFYGAALLRSTFAGVSVASHYQRDARDDLALTGLTAGQIVRGQWAAALYPARGWLVALGLVRFMAVILMMAEYQFNIYWGLLTYLDSGGTIVDATSSFHWGFSFVQLPLALGMAFGLTLLDGWTTTGVGLLLGQRIRGSARALVLALGFRVLPILIFSWFPSYSWSPLVSASGPHNLLSVRHLEYSWFAFADGGTGAALRLTRPVLYPARPMQVPFQNQVWGVVTHGLMACLAAFHMLLIYGLGAYTLMVRQWRRMRKIRVRVRLPRQPFRANQVAIVGLALAGCVWLVLAWGQRAGSALPEMHRYVFYDLSFIGGLESFLRLAVGVTTLGAILGGIWQAGVFQASAPGSVTWRALLEQAYAAVRSLRGWWLGLGCLLITAYGVLIVEHLVNIRSIQIYDCALRANHSFCGYSSFGWSVLQWVIGLGLLIVLSGVIVAGAGLLGFGAGMVCRSRPLAVGFAVALRLIPVVLALLPSEVQIPDSTFGILVPRWQQNPMITVADSGISVLFGITEPFNNFGHVSGRINMGYGLLAFMLVMYMLLGYGFGSVLLARWALRRRARTGCEAPSVRLVEAALPVPESEIRCA